FSARKLRWYTRPLASPSRSARSIGVSVPRPFASGQVGPLPLGGSFCMMAVTVIVTAPPLGSVTPAMVTAMKRWFGGQSMSGTAKAPVQSGAPSAGMEVVVLLELVVLVLVELVVAVVEVVVDELVLVDVDVVVEVVEELVEDDVLLVVVGLVMVNVPATPTIVIVRGPLCASMLAGVNTKLPLAPGFKGPTSISSICP